MDSASGAGSQSSALVSTAPSPVDLSPYASIVAIRFSDQTLHIHEYLLDASATLREAVCPKREINMSNISGAAGHILFTYLYKGSFEAHYNPKNTTAADLLRRCFEVYAVAKKYQLHHLCRTIQSDIKDLNPKLDSSEALMIVKEAYPLPDTADVWLRDYTKALLDATYTDVASFIASDLMATENAESTMSITEWLLRSVISSARDKEEKAKLEAKEREAAEKLRRELWNERDVLDEKRALRGKLCKVDRTRYKALVKQLGPATDAGVSIPARNGSELSVVVRGAEPELQPASGTVTASLTQPEPVSHWTTLNDKSLEVRQALPDWWRVDNPPKEQPSPMSNLD